MRKNETLPAGRQAKNIFLNKITEEVLSGKSITLEQANKLKEVKDEDIYSLFNAADAIRGKFRGKRWSFAL